MLIKKIRAKTGGFFVLFLSLALTFSCTPTRYVKPLQKKEIAVSAHLGGPFIGFAGAIIPVPFTSVGAAYGLRENVTVYSNFHVTSALFGTIQWDMGGLYAPLKPDKWKPGLSFSFTGNFAVDKWEGNFKFWPQLDINAYWEYSKKRGSFVYTGLSNWFETALQSAHGEKQRLHWIPALQVGHTFQWTKWDFNTEFKYAGLNVRSDVVVDYKSFGKYGAPAIYLGVTRRF